MRKKLFDERLGYSLTGPRLALSDRVNLQLEKLHAVPLGVLATVVLTRALVRTMILGGPLVAHAALLLWAEAVRSICFDLIFY